MKKILIRESDLIRIIEEALPIGKMAARVKKLKNLDSIERTIKNIKDDLDLMDTFNDIFKEAFKKKNISELETLQARLIHIFAPSNNSDDQKIGRQKALVVLNSYAIIKKFQSWKELKETIEKGEINKPTEKPKEKPKTSYDSPEYQRMAAYYREVNRKRKEEGKSRHWSPDYDKMADRYRRKKKDYYDDGGIIMESKNKLVHIINELFSDKLQQNLIQRFQAENPKLEERTIKFYIDRFQQIKNSPKVINKDITKYSWKDLEILVDLNQKDDDIEIGGDSDLIYNQNGLKIYHTNSKRACIKYGTGYNFCISARGSDNAYDGYAFDKQYTIYFVIDENKTKEQIRKKNIFTNQEYNGKFKDKFHLLIIMVKSLDLDDTDATFSSQKYNYQITTADNDGETHTSNWMDVVRFQPKLKHLMNLFIPREKNPIETKLRSIYSKYQDKLRELNQKMYDVANAQGVELTFGDMSRMDLISSIIHINIVNRYLDGNFPKKYMGYNKSDKLICFQERYDNMSADEFKNEYNKKNEPTERQRNDKVYDENYIDKVYIKEPKPSKFFMTYLKNVKKIMLTYLHEKNKLNYQAH